MDLFADFDSKKNAQSGARMALKDPRTDAVIMCQGDDDKEPRENYLVLKGIDSPDTKRAFKKLQGFAKLDEKQDISNDEYEAAEKNACTALAKLTVGGEVFGKVDEKAKKSEWVQMNPDNAYSLYNKASTFRDQAMAFILNKGNFIGS